MQEKKGVVPKKQKNNNRKPNIKTKTANLMGTFKNVKKGVFLEGLLGEMPVEQIQTNKPRVNLREQVCMFQQHALQ